MKQVMDTCLDEGTCIKSRFGNNTSFLILIKCYVLVHDTDNECETALQFYVCVQKERTKVCLNFYPNVRSTT